MLERSAMKESTTMVGLRERTAATAVSSFARERPWSNSVFAESGKVSGSARRRAVSRPMPSDEPVRRMTLPMWWGGEQTRERACTGRGEEKKRRRGEREGGQNRG